jgi:hypothetical protein
LIPLAVIAVTVVVVAVDLDVAGAQATSNRIINGIRSFIRI